MAPIARPHFPRRRNSDGSFDSVCIECFRMVAIRVEEADLAGPEADHICDGFSSEGMPYSEPQGPVPTS
jgi:hypothetical protein